MSDMCKARVGTHADRPTNAQREVREELNSIARYDFTVALNKAKERVTEMDARMRTGEERQRRICEGLKEQAHMYKSEIEDLNASLQASQPYTFQTVVQFTIVRRRR